MPPPPLSPLEDVQSATGSITQLLLGTLAGAYALTLSLYIGADGNADVQATHDTPIGSLLEYAAGLAGIPATDIAILHPNVGSLDVHGPNICDVPGLGLWDNVTVLRWVYIDALSLLHRQDTQGRIQMRTLGNLQMRIRTDATGMQVWRRIFLQIQRECPPDTRQRGTPRAPYPGDHIARHNHLVGTQNLVGDARRAPRGSTPRGTGALHGYSCMLLRNDGLAGALRPRSGGLGRGPA